LAGQIRPEPPSAPHRQEAESIDPGTWSAGMQIESGFSPAARFLVAAGSFVLVVAGMRAAAPLITPFRSWLRRKRRGGIRKRRPATLVSAMPETTSNLQGKCWIP